MALVKRSFAMSETAFLFLRNRHLFPRVAASVPSRGCKGTNGLKGQQAFSPGHRPGYLGSGRIRPGRAKAPMEINLADSRSIVQSTLIYMWIERLNKKTCRSDCFNCDDKCACRKTCCAMCILLYIY